MIVTFMSDFGLEDNFVGVVKGVILSYAPDTMIVDITHHIPKFNIEAAGYVLENTYKYFPSGSLHLVVVDPGVGTKRDILYVELNSHFFVVPDNGLISIFREKLEHAKLFKYVPSDLPKINTFHGRDLFAPLVGKLISEDISDSELQKIELTQIKQVDFAKPIITDHAITGKVILIDHFGNVITNISDELIMPGPAGETKNLQIMLSDGRTLQLPIYPSYGYVSKGKPLCVFSSFSTLELSINQGSFAKTYGVKPGDEIKVLF